MAERGGGGEFWLSHSFKTAKNQTEKQNSLAVIAYKDSHTLVSTGNYLEGLLWWSFTTELLIQKE